MRRTIGPLSALALLATGAVALSPGTPAVGAPAVTTVQGTVTAAGAGALTIATSAGPSRVRTTATTRVLHRLPARLEDIKVGDFIGVAARREANGALTAVSINIFPPALRGRIREGQFAMESGNIMTNAVVTQYVSRVSGRTVTLTYAAGAATIAVPPSTQIHRLTVGSLAELRPGMHVIARGTAGGDGALIASSITVEGPGLP